jgi:hypothetical protein
MEARLPGLGNQGLDAIDQHLGDRQVVSGYVIQFHIAKTALLPVAAVRHGEFVPATVRP